MQVPWPGAVSIDHVPPSSSVRSLMEVSPTPGRNWFRRFHYRWALDKWPLLLSVVRGKVSLVGPQPGELSGRRIALVKPGITGFVQIHRHEHLTPEEVEELEIYYLRNQSLMLDMQILWSSLWRIIRSGGGSEVLDKSSRDNQDARRARCIGGSERIENERIRSRI